MDFFSSSLESVDHYVLIKRGVKILVDNTAINLYVFLIFVHKYAVGSWNLRYNRDRLKNNEIYKVFDILKKISFYLLLSPYINNTITSY